MKKQNSKYQNNFYYIFSILSLSSFSIFLLFSLNNKNQNRQPGFGDAVAITNNKNLCLGGYENIKCQKNLIKKLKSSKKNILFFGNSQTGAINNYVKGSGNISFGLSIGMYLGLLNL